MATLHVFAKQLTVLLVGCPPALTEIVIDFVAGET